MRSEVQLFPDPPSLPSVAFPELIALSLCAATELEARRRQFSYGAVAQLGEHLLCKQGVTGSIPVSSTIAPIAPLASGLRRGALKKSRHEAFLEAPPGTWFFNNLE